MDANEIIEDLRQKIEDGFEDLRQKIKESNAKIKKGWDKQMKIFKVKINKSLTKIKSSKIFQFNPFDPSSWEDSDNFDEAEELPSSQFTVETFEELRSHNTPELALKVLNELATDLKTIELSQLTESPRVCFILCNTYTKPEYKLGVGPINDSITVAANHKRMGYTVYFLHDPQPSVFLEYLKFFIENTTQYLTIFYTGHGANIKDTDQDEDDGFDEVLVFDEDYIRDDVLADIIKENANGETKIILLNDCCHSGTIWDIPTDEDEKGYFPANIICLSAADDDELAKQGRSGFNDQGFFTFLLFQEVRINKSITPKDIQNKLSTQLVKYSQTVKITPTRPEMLEQPLFPQE